MRSAEDEHQNESVQLTPSALHSTCCMLVVGSREAHTTLNLLTGKEQTGKTV